MRQMKEIFNKAVLILALSMALIIETRAENMPSPGMKDDKEQPVQTIRGTVVDAVTGQPLTGATIMIEESAGVGASADENGQFEIKNLRICRSMVSRRWSLA
jgi:hypothetical protein